MIIRLSLVLLLTLSSTLVALPRAGDLVSRASSVLLRGQDSWRQLALATVLALGVLGTTTAIAQDIPPDEVAEGQDFTLLDLNPAYSLVTDGAPDHYESALYMLLSTPEGETTHMHPIVYLGDDPEGNAVFMGMFLRGHEEEIVSIWDRRGLVQDEVNDIELRQFPDPIGGWSEINIFVAEGLHNLGAKHTPANVASFPFYSIGQELEMLAWGEELESEPLLNLPLWSRQCYVTDPHGWAAGGVGLHTCVPPWTTTYHNALGSLIFDKRSGDLVGFFTDPSHTAFRSEGTHDEVLEFIAQLELNHNAFAAPSRSNKIPTTWAAIKKSRD